MSVLVIGTVGYDTIETARERVDNVLGGSATYFAVAARFFSPVSVVTAIGADFRPEHWRLFTERGIDLRAVEATERSTFRWHGRYNEDFSRRETVALSFNSFTDFRPDLLPDQRQADYVFFANVPPALQRHVIDQLNRPKLVGADTMDHWIADQRQALLAVMAQVNLLILTETEARMLTQEHNLLKAARALVRIGPRAVIIKRGENGLIQFTPESTFIAAGYPVDEVRDPTGAGDSLAGAVIGYLARVGRTDDGTLRTAAIYGNVMGSFAVEQFSVNRLTALTWEEIEERYREFIEFTDALPGRWTSR
jgi:sugar/nucleoside kinase (ribokinase family)